MTLSLPWCGTSSAWTFWLRCIVRPLSPPFVLTRHSRVGAGVHCRKSWHAARRGVLRRAAPPRRVRRTVRKSAAAGEHFAGLPGLCPVYWSLRARGGLSFRRKAGLWTHSLTCPGLPTCSALSERTVRTREASAGLPNSCPRLAYSPTRCTHVASALLVDQLKAGGKWAEVFRYSEIPRVENEL